MSCRSDIVVALMTLEVGCAGNVQVVANDGGSRDVTADLANDGSVSDADAIAVDDAPAHATIDVSPAPDAGLPPILDASEDAPPDTLVDDASLCSPGSCRQAGSGVETCGTYGVWFAYCDSGSCETDGGQTVISCNYGTCPPGTTQCAGNGVQTCGANGWGTPSQCMNSSCIAGQCTGVCEPGATKCSFVPVNGVQTCSASGEWVTAVACINQGCVDGACKGACTPGETRCTTPGNSVQSCDALGQWGSPVGTCVCTPGATRCTGNAVQACTVNWVWGISSPCDQFNEACVNGACQGTCIPGNTFCSGGVLWTCDALGNYTDPCDGGPCDAGTDACPPEAPG